LLCRTRIDGLQMQFLRKHWPCIAIIGIYVFCILIANPRGEFPLNDDWSYTRSAFSFGSGRGMKVDEWSAPSLVGQALYGGLLVKIFSPHFTVLRLSTLLLSCCTAILLWGTLMRLRVHREFSCWVLLSWVFNPLQFNLSFTFMTEIPFLFFLALAVYWYVHHLESDKSVYLVLSAAALGYAFLIRQTALLFLLALIGSVLLDLRTGWARRIRRTVSIAAPAGCLIAGYYAWVIRQGGATAAVHRKLDLLSRTTSRQILGNGYGLLFYLAFMLLPVLLFLIPHLNRLTRGFRVGTRIGIVVGWSAIALSGVLWFQTHAGPGYLPSTTYHSRMPFLINVLYDSGLGPITLDPAYFGPSPTPTYPKVWLAVTVLAALGSVILASSLDFSLIRFMSIGKPLRSLFIFSAAAFAAIALFEVIFSHPQEGGLFDRHILSAAYPVCILLVLAFFPGEGRGAGGSGRTGFWAAFGAGIILAGFAAFSVAATRDYMEWNRIRWDMGRALLGRGVDPLGVAGGFEFNAWHNYDTFVARGNIAKVYQWWYDRRDYMITMNPQDGYETMQKKEYFSWVHLRPIALYVIRRDSQIQHPAAGSRQ
jgi:hypothetical protein